MSEQAKRFRIALFLVVVGPLLLDLPLFTFANVAPSILPKYWLVLLGVAAIAGGALAAGARPALLALTAATALYTLVNVLALSWTPDDDAAMRELVTRLTGLGTLLITAFVVARAREAADLRPWLALVAGIGALFVLADLAQGTAWSTTIGRAAGSYGNPNTTASTLSFLAVAAVTGLPDRWRVPYFVAISLAAVATLSRAGYLLAATGAILLMVTKVIRPTALLKAGLIAGLAGILLAPIALRVIVQVRPEFEVLTQLSVSDLLRLNAGDVSSTSERQEVAAAALDVFFEHPVLGAGLTATSAWSHPVSTHNQVLRVMAELGLVGLAAFGALIAAVLVGGGVRRAESGPSIVVWLLVLMAVSHNVLDDWSLLAALGVIAGGGLAGDQVEDRTEWREA